MTGLRFLLVRTDRIGDTVLTLPAVTALRERFPEASISFLARTYTHPILRNYEGIDQILTYDPQKHRGWKGLRRLAAELREQDFSTAILFHPRPELALPLKWAGIPQRIGSADRWYRFLFTDRLSQHRSQCARHEADYNLELLKPVLQEDVPAQFAFSPRLQVPEPLKVREGLPPRYAILHPGSGGSAPNLSLHQYRLLIETLLRETDWAVVVTGSFDDASLAEQLRAGFPEARVLNRTGRFSLEEMLQLVGSAELLLASSTGPIHLADALNRPLLSFYCPAVPFTPRRWGPYQQRQWVLLPEITEPRTCRGSDCPHGGCLSLLTDEGLVERIRERLQALERQ